MPRLPEISITGSRPDGGEGLDLRSIDGLVGKRNHVLKVALAGLDPDAQKLLGRLSLFSSSADYAELAALNPRLPPRPQATHAEERTAWEQSPERAPAERWLRRTLQLLRSRGLVIREGASYDLHPLVRGFIRASLSAADRAAAAGEIADFASGRAPARVADTSTGEELDSYFEVVRLLLLGDHLSRAREMLDYTIYHVARANGRLRAHFELLAQFFEPGFTAKKPGVPHSRFLAAEAGLAAGWLGRHTDQDRAVRLAWKDTVDQVEPLSELRTVLGNLAASERALRRMSAARRSLGLCALISETSGLSVRCRHAYVLCRDLPHFGELNWRDYAPLAVLDDPTSFQGLRRLIPRLFAAKIRIDSLAETLTEEQVEAALSHDVVRPDVGVRHEILIEKARLLRRLGAEAQARGVFAEALRLGRESDAPVAPLEAEYATTLARLGETTMAREKAQRLAELRQPPHLRLAELWLALDQIELARKHALLAYPQAWADGPPNAFHWELRDCRALLAAIGEPEPRLRSVRPEDLPPIDFEDELLKRIEQAKREQPHDGD